MVLTTWCTTVPPFCATCAALLASWLAWRAASALWRTVAVSSSMLLAVSCRLLAVCSVRWLRSWLPLAISLLAVCMPCAASRTVCTAMAVRPSTSLSSRASEARTSRPDMSSTMWVGSCMRWASAATSALPRTLLARRTTKNSSKVVWTTT